MQNVHKVKCENERLLKEFFIRDTITVARELIGKIFVKILNHNTILSAKIVETEAYLPNDDVASHSFCGITKRNQMMFEEGGVLYIYKSYGIHHCVNIVTEQKGKGSAVLIRAMEPIQGIQIMKKYRNRDDIKVLCKGPGNVAKAFGLSLNENGMSILGDQIMILNADKIDENDIIKTKRIGISKSKDLLLRFYLKNSKFVSKM